MTRAEPAPKPLINLLKGWPHPSLLPAEQLKAAAQSVLSNTEIAIPALCYGPDEGDLRLRKALAQWLSSFYGGEADHMRICVTGGASQNLACILQTFSDPAYTRNVWIVAPAYMLVFRIFNDSGLQSKLRAVPEDDEGVDVEFLKRALVESEKAQQSKIETQPLKMPQPWSKFYKHIIYAVPTFSNPSSRTMSLRRREALVRLARTHDALIITDDVYDHLQWFVDDAAAASTPVRLRQQPRLVDVDRELDGGVGADLDCFGNAVSNGSFSKICAPGVRTGWVEATPKFAYGLSQTGSSRSGGAPSHLTASCIAELLEEGKLEEHVFETLQPAYSRRWRTMMAAIEKLLLPLGCHLPQKQREIVGGYFIWIHLPEGMDGNELVDRARLEENLIVAPGEIFAVPGDDSLKFTNDIRLCIAWEDEDKLEVGIERLARVMSDILEGKPSLTLEHSESGKTDSEWVKVEERPTR